MRRSYLLAGTVATALLLVFGCLGDDGAQGPQGPTGDPGKPQPVKILFAGSESPSNLQDLVVGANACGCFPLGTEFVDYAATDSLIYP